MPLGQSVHQPGPKESACGHAMNPYPVPGTRPSPYNKGKKLQRREVVHKDPQRYAARKNTRDNGRKTKHINVLTVCMRVSGWIIERIVRTRKLYPSRLDCPSMLTAPMAGSCGSSTKTQTNYLCTAVRYLPDTRTSIFWGGFSQILESNCYYSICNFPYLRPAPVDAIACVVVWVGFNGQSCTWN